MNFNDLMESNREFDALPAEEKIRLRSATEHPTTNVDYSPGRVNFSYDEYYRLLLNRGYMPENARAVVDSYRKDGQRIWVDKKPWYDIVKDVVMNAPDSFFGLAADAIRMDRNAMALAQLGKDIVSGGGPALDALVKHYSGLLDINTAEGRQIMAEYISNNPSDVAADISMFAVPAGGMALRGTAAMKALNSSRFGRYLKTTGKTLLDPANAVEFAEIDLPGAIGRETTDSFDDRFGTVTEGGGYTPAGGSFRWQGDDAAQQRAAASYKTGPHIGAKRTRSAYENYMGEVDADIQTMKERLFQPGQEREIAASVIDSYADRLVRGDGDPEFGGLTPEQLDKNLGLFERELGRELTADELNDLINPALDNSALRAQLANEWLTNHIGDWFDMTATEAGTAMAKSSQDALNAWNAKIGVEYERALTPIKDSQATYARTIEVIEGFLEENTQATGAVTSDLVKLQTLLDGLKADNTAGITVGKMDRFRTRFRMNMMDDRPQAKSRIPLDEAMNEQIYGALSDDLFEAAKPNGAVYSELELIKKKDAIFIAQGERGFRKIIQKYSDPQSPEWSPEKLAKTMLNKPDFLTENVVSDIERHMGGIDSMGWRAFQSYYLDELLETKARGKGDTTMGVRMEDGQSVFSAGGLARALKNQEGVYPQVLGADNAAFLEAMSKELQSFEVFQQAIGGSQTAWNQAAMFIFGGFRRGAAYGGAGYTAWHGLEEIGRTVLGVPDMAADIGASMVVGAAGLLKVFGTDFYNGMRKTPNGSAMPTVDQVEKVIRNTRRTYVPATRISLQSQE